MGAIAIQLVDITEKFIHLVKVLENEICIKVSSFTPDLLQGLNAQIEIINFKLFHYHELLNL